MHSIRPSARILAIGLALGIVVDLLFHGHALGISIPLFVLLLLGALFYLGQRQGLRPAWRNLWLLAPLLFLSAMVAVRASPFLTFLNVVASLALLGLVAHFYAAGHLERLSLVGYPVVWLRVGLNAFYRAAPLLSESGGGEALRQGARGRALPVVRGLLLALPVLAVFTCLLSSADLIFARYVKEVLSLPFWRQIFGRATVVLVSAWLLAGGLAYALGRSATAEEGSTFDRVLASVARAVSRDQAAGEQDGLDSLLNALARVFSLGLVEGATVLATVDLLFATFVGIQFAYLFGGEANITAQGFTYAQYARRGFFELVTVAVLSLGFVLGLHWLTRRQTPAQERLFNGLGSLLAGLVLVMLASAFYRLRLYEVAYGLTELRLYVYVFMAWLGVAIVWFVVALWRLPRRFAIGGLVVALGFLVTLNLLNPDAFIARQNLARYQDSGKLDACYLTTLSEDAMPVLLAAVDQVTGDERKVLLEHLQRREQRLRDDRRWRTWPSLHLSRWRAFDLLVADR